MAACDPYGFRDGQHRRGDGETLKIMVALRVLLCFAAESQTLTSREIGSQLNLPAADVMRAATKLTYLGYLVADSTNGKSAWTRTPR
jgi:IclR helix-turn-helix domain